MSWREFRVMEDVRRARVLAWTLNCVTGTCDTERGLKASMKLDMVT